MTPRDDESDIGYWDAEAKTFDAEPDHGLHDPEVRRAWRTLLTGLLPPPPAHVADLGCGTGTLSLLLAEDGYAVDGVDFSPEMVRRAQAKAGSFRGTSFVVGDVSDPQLPGGYDAVLCRHVLWVLPDPGAALRRWARLLAPAGRMVLVEGYWSPGVGLTRERTLVLVEEAGLRGEHASLDDPVLWGRPIDDERYVVVARQ